MLERPVNRGSLDDLLVFHEMARSLTSTHDLDAIFRIVHQYMDRFIAAELWALLVVDHEREDIYYASPEQSDGTYSAGHRTGTSANSGLRIKMGEGLAGWVARHGETLIIPDAAMDLRLSGAAEGRSFTVRSAIGLPIRGRKGTHAVLEIFNPRMDELNEQSGYGIALLHILADYAAIAIENAQDVALAQQLTITDDVTGLYNARHLYAVLDRELENARKDATPLSLAFLDLDRFKTVNDAHGHLAGSEILGMVGKRIRELCRAADLCFRYGGDEFVIVMPRTTRQEAVSMARSIHTVLSSAVFTLSSGVQQAIGASTGIATYPGDGRTVHAILGAADQRMYAIKNSGRGRVEAG